MTQSKEIQIVNRAKITKKDAAERRDINKSNSRERTRVGSTITGNKGKDDLTFQNLEDMVNSPNKVGFDSLESAIEQP